MSSSTDDAMAQIARLRDQVEILMREKVRPAMEGAADRVEASARDGTARLGVRVREQPLQALLIAVAIGFVLGRVSR